MRIDSRIHGASKNRLSTTETNYAFAAARTEIIDQMRRMSYKIYSISADEFYGRNKGNGRDEWRELARADITDALDVQGGENQRDALQREARDAILEKAIINLDSTESEILSRKFGLQGYAVHQNLEIATAMGYHKSRICILLGFAIDKIRGQLTEMGLTLFDLVADGDVSESERMLDEEIIEKLTQIVDHFGSVTATAKFTSLPETTITRTMKRTGKILPKNKTKIEAEFMKIFGMENQD